VGRYLRLSLTTHTHLQRFLWSLQYGESWSVVAAQTSVIYRRGVGNGLNTCATLGRWWSEVKKQQGFVARDVSVKSIAPVLQIYADGIWMSSCTEMVRAETIESCGRDAITTEIGNTERSWPPRRSARRNSSATAIYIAGESIDKTSRVLTFSGLQNHSDKRNKSRRRPETSVSKRTLDRLVNALSKVLNVSTVQASHGDTPIGGHVYMRLLSECLGLWCGEAGEARGEKGLAKDARFDDW